MSIWSRIIDSIYAPDNGRRDSTRRDASRYAMVDVEVGYKDHRIHDIGAIRHDGATFHSPRLWLCGDQKMPRRALHRVPLFYPTSHYRDARPKMKQLTMRNYDKLY